ncbi:FxLD family lanthipeptide [Streptomyces tauricus]|uniref:FxLD family lanthipeptide n=1 Tax=Streptomyces tauricus TaxID=68274 RepID=UPI001BC9EC14
MYEMRTLRTDAERDEAAALVQDRQRWLTMRGLSVLTRAQEAEGDERAEHFTQVLDHAAENTPAGAARSSLTAPHPDPGRHRPGDFAGLLVWHQTPGPDRVSVPRTIRPLQEACMTATQTEKPTAPAQADLVKADEDPFGLDITFIEGTPANETVLMCGTGDNCGSSCPSACTTS